MRLETSKMFAVPSIRLDLEAFKDDVKEGMISLRELQEKHTLVFAKYPRYVRENVQDHQPKIDVECHM